MSNHLNPADQAAITLIESAADHRAILERLVVWPGLSPLQRAIALVAQVEMNRFGVGAISAAHVAGRLDIPEADVLKQARPRVFPLAVSMAGDVAHLSPTEALAYEVMS